MKLIDDNFFSREQTSATIALIFFEVEPLRYTPLCFPLAFRGSHLHQPRAAGAFVAGRPTASAGPFNHLRNQKTLVLGESRSTDSLNVAASRDDLNTPPQATATVLPDNQTTPYYEKPPPEDALFTITHSAGWEQVLMAVVQNLKVSIDEVILVDNFGRLYPFQDVSGSLTCPGPSASDFPIYIMKKELVDTCRETQKESSSPEPVEPRILEQDFPVPTEGGGTPPLHPTSPEDGRPEVPKKDDPIPPPKDDGYGDGSYWKKLGFHIHISIFEHLFFHVLSLSCCFLLFRTPLHPSYFHHLRIRRFITKAEKGKVKASPELVKLWGTPSGRNKAEVHDFTGNQIQPKNIILLCYIGYPSMFICHLR